MEDVIAVFGVFFAPAAVLITLLIVQLKSRRMANETLRHLVENGQQPDAELFRALLKNASDAVQDKRRAILLIMFAVSIAGFSLAVGEINIMAVAIFPLAIGIGYILTSKFAAKEAG